MEPMSKIARTEKRIEVIIVGCGKPKFSMGWTHMFQLLQEPLASLADVVGVVEPFYLSEIGKGVEGADAFRAYMAEHPSILVVDACDKLPPVDEGKIRVAVISVRTLDAKHMFEEAVSKAGCRAVYCEKPGAATVGEMDELLKLSEEKGITVMTGYSRNCGTYVSRGRAFATEKIGSGVPKITLLHSNPWRDEDMTECFSRCRPGMFYDMACHDLAVAAAFYGLTADGYTDLTVDEEKSLQANYGGIEDFVRVKFSLRPKAGADPITFVIDRQTGAFNGMQVDIAGESKRFLSGEPPLLFENPLSDLSPHLAVQYDYYVEAKRILLSTLAARAPSDKAVPLPAGVPTLMVAREVMLLADKLTNELRSLVPKVPSVGTA